MDPVFDAQYLTMKRSFSREGPEIEVAYTPDGEVDYVYVVGRLLARDVNVQRLQDVLPTLRRADPDEQRAFGDLVLLSLDSHEEGYLTVPEALDLIDERLGTDNPVHTGGEPLATPVHIVHTAKLCAATEKYEADPPSTPAVDADRGLHTLAVQTGAVVSGKL